MNTLFDQAEKARQSSRFKNAQRIYKTLLRKSLPHEEKAEALLGLADVERIQGYFTDSLKHYQSAAQLLKKIDPSAQVDAQVGWALAARAVGRPQEALRELKKALASYKKDKDPQGEAFVHWALGGTLRIAGDMKGGLKELQIALRMFKALRNPEGVSYTYCALGGIFRMLGRYAESGKFYGKANHEMRHRGDTFGIAYSYCGLGNVQRMAGRFKQALPFYKKAEKLYGTIGDRVSYAYTLWSIGTTYKMLGETTKAWQAFQKADALFQKTGDTRGRIYTLLGFAEVEWLKEVSSGNTEVPFAGGKRVKDARGRDKSRPYMRNNKGTSYWRTANTIASQSKFAWEKLHVESLKGGRVNPLKNRYLNAGSKFCPKSLPVNWP